jgi:hypothetical protein
MCEITGERSLVDDAVLPIKVRIDIEETGIKPFIVRREYKCREAVPMFVRGGPFCRPLHGAQREDLQLVRKSCMDQLAI